VQPIRSEAEVVQNSDEGGVNRRLLLRVDCWPGSQPGQFVMLSPGVRQAVERSDPLLPRPMAVYRVHPDPVGDSLARRCFEGRPHPSGRAAGAWLSGSKRRAEFCDAGAGRWRNRDRIPL
jgi:hypothetical protein